MRVRKNVLLLFSKPPIPGLVKTRLTTLKDGVFKPEVASALYHCMLFDVVEICCAALADMEARVANVQKVADTQNITSTKDVTDTRALGSALDMRGITNAQDTVTVRGAAAMQDVGDTANTQDTVTVRGADAMQDVGDVANTQDAAVAKDLQVRDEYELVISTTPAANVEVMRKLFEESGAWPRELVIIADEGASFDEHYNHAFEQAWSRGADAILSLGADMPALTKADVIGGFNALHRLDDMPDGGIVLAPDQEMGVSIVGWTRNTDFSHSGVFYNQDGLTVLPAYIAKARERNLPALYLPPVPDVDTMADLMHNITLVEALNYCALHDDVTPPWRTADALAQMGWSEVRVPPNDLHDPREEIDK